MGFKRDHTFNCMSTTARRKDSAKHEDTRCSLLCNTIQASMLAWLISPPLLEWGYLQRLPSFEELMQVKARTVPRQESEDVLLVRALCGMQTHRGGEIRQDTGAENLAQRPALQGLDAGWWQWSAVISCKWKLDSEPIVALEGRGFLLSLRWRGSTASRT